MKRVTSLKRSSLSLVICIQNASNTSQRTVLIQVFFNRVRFSFLFACIFHLIFLYWRQSILGFIFSFLLCKFLSNPDIRDLFICLMLLKYDLLENLIWLIRFQLPSGFPSESFYWFLELLDSISHWSMEWFWWLLVQGW